jgi:hypothetical protein
MIITGSCLCKKIAFEILPPLSEFTHCYCKRCRKASGAGRSSVLIIPARQLRWIKGARHVRRWDLATASSFATSFCYQCGCPSPRLTRAGEHAVVPAGSLDKPLPISPKNHEHWDSRANWICLDESHLPVHDHASP